MKKTSLNIFQRIIASTIYISVFVIGCRLLSGNWTFLFNSGSGYNVIFISAALLLILGSYIAEPFFTKPTDVLANSIAVILALFSINDKSSFVGYWYLFTASTLLATFSILLFFMYYFPNTRRFQQVATEILTQFGQSKVIFSLIYIATVFSFFSDKPFDFIFFVTFWAIFITNFLVEQSIIWFSKLWKLAKLQKSDLLGEAIGCENPFLYKVEIDYFKHLTRDTKKGELVYLSTEDSCGYVGIIVEEKYLLNKKWVSIYLLQKDNLPVKINLRSNEVVESSKSIFSSDSFVYSLDIELIKNEDTKNEILQNNLYNQRDSFVGYVSKGSNIHKLRFIALVDPTNSNSKLLREGTVVRTQIKDEYVLYQIIDGETTEEELDKHNIYGYLSGTANKLGVYKKSKKELEVAKWLPNIYSPIFFDNSQSSTSDPLRIGVLPETCLQIVLKDADSLVTHNTAILGILGIGKSCLTFELIKKVIEHTGAKVICIDITNEYKKELPNYIGANLIVDDLSEQALKDLKTNNRNGSQDDPTSWGNENYYIDKLKDELEKFDNDKNKRVFLLNPDWHSVSKAGSQFKISFKVDLTIAEKTRIISERLFMLAKKKWEDHQEEQNSKAKYLLVFEEAHSLIPEWNSTANSGDQSASNGTAKVILQGRKYGFGSLVVTQRTANISKSILNQCNTIFALRVFDDTGKQFLENYIGADYSNTLPTLAERNAIVVGKALNLKQPVIVTLNDRDDIINSS